MSFFTDTTNINPKPHFKQKGFTPDDLYTSTSNNTGFHAKYPSPPLNLPSMDFGDDLAGLMAADSNGGDNGNSRSSPPNGYQQQQHLHHDDHYRHNIFDTQSPQHSLSLSLDGSSSHHSYSSSHHSYSHSLSIPKSPTGFTSSTSSSNATSNGQVTSPLLTTLPLGNGNATSRARSHSHSLSHGQQQQHHGHHGHTASLSHSLSHSSALNGGLNPPIGSLGIGGGYGMNGMGMNSLGGSMGMMGMGNMGVVNGGLSLGPVQSPTLQSPSLSANNVNPSLSTSLPSPPGPHLTSSPPSTTTTTTTNYQDKQSLLANEKRRRRRESHNAVERRRRDNINEKISELATLIPECMLEGGGSSVVATTNPNRGSSSPTSACGGIGILDSSDPLLPSSYGLTNGNTNGSSSPAGMKEENVGDGESAGIVKANKGMILRKSVDYIRYLQQLVTAQGARNRELEQELKAYRRSSGSSSSPKLNGYPPAMSNAIGGGGTRTASHSRSSPGSSREEDAMILHDGVDSVGVGGGGVIEFGGYAGRGDRRGGLLSMPEGDDENVDYDDSQHHHHQHQQHHQQHPQHHQYRQEDMVVDNLGMGMNMEMMGGMNTMNGGTMHFNGVDNSNNNAAAEDLRGRPRLVRHLDSDGADKNATGAGGSLKEEDDNDVVGGFGIGNGRSTHGM